MRQFPRTPRRTSPTWLLLAISAVAVSLQMPKTLGLSLLGLAIMIAFLWATDRPTLRSIGGPKFWITGLALAGLSGMLLGKRYETFYGLSVSVDGLNTGVMIVVRAAVLVSAIFALSSRVSADQLVRAFARIGVPQAGAALALGMKLMPHMVRRWKTGTEKGERPRLIDRTAMILVHAAHLSEEIARDTDAWMAERKHTSIFCVTGPVGGGKSQWLLRLIDALEQKGMKAGGFVQVAAFEADSMSGYDLLLLPERERFAFARAEDDPERRGWRFDEELFERAEKHLGALGDADVWIADELGWMERSGEGHWPALARTVPGKGGVWVLACRFGLAGEFVSRLGYLEYELFNVPADEKESQEMIARILKAAAERDRG